MGKRKGVEELERVEEKVTGLRVCSPLRCQLDVSWCLSVGADGFGGHMMERRSSGIIIQDALRIDAVNVGRRRVG